MAGPTLYHLNPTTERIGICRATPKGHCPFSAVSPHFTTKEEAQAYYENKLEAEYGIFGKTDGELSLNREIVARRLNLLPEEALNELIHQRWRRGGYTPREADQMLKDDEPFYVYYTANQEITMDAQSSATQRTFMRGACALFGEELQRATGYPLVVFSSDELPGLWQGHVALKLPDGNYLDVSGLSDDPLWDFPAGSSWRVSEARNAEELREQTANRDSRGKSDSRTFPLLERFALAQLVYDTLDGEGLLTD